MTGLEQHAAIMIGDFKIAVWSQTLTCVVSAQCEPWWEWLSVTNKSLTQYSTSRPCLEQYNLHWPKEVPEPCHISFKQKRDTDHAT